MLSKLAIRRLTKLADYMERLPKKKSKHFRMSAWFAHRGVDSEHGLRRNHRISTKELNYCGTSACALGWACMIPAFKRAGLSLLHDGIIGEVRFRKDCDFDAAANFFELNEEQSMKLFSGVFDLNTPKQWAARCRKFLRDNA